MKKFSKWIRRNARPSSYTILTAIFGIAVMIVFKDSQQFAAIAAMVGVVIGAALSFGIEFEKWRWQRRSEIIGRRSHIIEDYVTQVLKFIRLVHDARRAITTSPPTGDTVETVRKYIDMPVESEAHFDLVIHLSASLNSQELFRAIRGITESLEKVQDDLRKVFDLSRSQGAESETQEQLIDTLFETLSKLGDHSIEAYRALLKVQVDVI